MQLPRMPFMHAVGNLAITPRKELLVLTIFKNKAATTSVAHLRDGSPTSTPAPTDTWGVVTLKYCFTPHDGLNASTRRTGPGILIEHVHK